MITGIWLQELSFEKCLLSKESFFYIIFWESVIMSKIVVKFGGSNLKNSDDLKRIVEVVKLYNQPLVVVVSALFGVTERLQEILIRLDEHLDGMNKLSQYLYDIHVSMIDRNIIDPIIKNTTKQGINDRLSELEKYLIGIHFIGETPDFVKDLVLSFGERLSSYLITSIFKDNGIDSQEILPEELGLITNGKYGSASIDFESSTKKVAEKLSGNKTYIIPGFYGISLDGKVNILGRGGSDYSAAAIAKCIKADSLDIWKDVDGFLSADPKIIKNQVVINNLTYNEAAELSYFGAKILHPRTVEPLIESNIKIKLYNIRDYKDLNPVTIINAVSHISKNIVKSVTYTDDISILKLKGVGVGIEPGILSKITTSFDINKINIKSVLTTQTAINFILSKDDIFTATELIKKLNLEIIYSIECVIDISLIAVVGEGMVSQKGIAKKVSGAIAKKNINIEIMSLGASDVAAYFIVKAADCLVAINEIHSEFFNN
jgi:bifunctional aspartokinase / homoserine dehydrogenase 1